MYRKMVLDFLLLVTRLIKQMKQQSESKTLQFIPGGLLQCNFINKIKPLLFYKMSQQLIEKIIERCVNKIIFTRICSI